jgi:hypothetical protein
VPSFAVAQPIATREPTIVVDPGLPLGRHRFQLEVVDAEGRVSKPDLAEVEIVRSSLQPTGPVVSPTRDVVSPVAPPIRRPPIPPE